MHSVLGIIHGEQVVTEYTGRASGHVCFGEARFVAEVDRRFSRGGLGPHNHALLHPAR